MKRKALAAISVAAVLLTGCSASPSEPNEGGIGEGVNVFEVSLPQGGAVQCVYVKTGYSGGLSCDWGDWK